MKDETEKLNEEVRETLIDEIIDLNGQKERLFNDLFNNNNRSVYLKIKLHLLSEQIDQIKQILINNKF